MGAHLADYGLTAMDDEAWRKHDLLIIHLRARWRDGYRRLLPVLRRSR